MEQNRFLVITGMSGAGKTQVLHTLEDLNYFCVDNLPAMLIPKFAELSRQTPGRDIAMVVDARGGQFFDSLLEVLEEMRATNLHYELLFLDASDACLIRRYKETRRRHPLERGRHNLAASVALERKSLEKIREKADEVIDTTDITSLQLKQRIIQLYGDSTQARNMMVVVQSFGFKNGLPLDSDLVMDVRFLPNPFYEEQLKNLDGNDIRIADFLNKFPQTYEFLKLQTQLLDFLLPYYEKEGKSQLVISIGCTGGHHRSVYIASRIYDYLRLRTDLNVELVHRDLGRKV